MFGEAFGEIKRISGDPEIVELARQREQALFNYHFDRAARDRKSRAEGRAEGKAEGKAESIFAILETKKLSKGMSRESFVTAYSSLPLESLESALIKAAMAQTQQEVLDFLNSSKP